jgi:hypothetical protein
MKKTKKKVAKKVVPLRSFVFTGNQDDPGSDPHFIEKHRYTFQKNGKPIMVGAATAAKLESNSWFTEQ